MSVDPTTIVAGFTAAKNGFDMLRSAIGLVKEAKGLLPNDPEKDRAATVALDQAEKATQIAEAQLAQALGFELCKCDFPPTIMTTVGHHVERGGSPKGPVFECAKCGYNTAGPWAFSRIAPPRVTGGLKIKEIKRVTSLGDDSADCLSPESE